MTGLNNVNVYISKRYVCKLAHISEPLSPRVKEILIACNWL